MVGADPLDGHGRGVVSTASYAAREYGIHSAMPISWAWRASKAAEKEGKPAAVFLVPDFRKYTASSRRIAGVIRRHADIVEQASIDEFYIDLSFSGSFVRAKEICMAIKKEILDAEKLTCSIGLAANKLVAKIASDFNKPCGLTVVEENDAETFLAPLPIRKIPGIGPKSEAMFQEHGIGVIRDLEKFSKEDLEGMLGKWGSILYERVRGRDPTPLVLGYTPKSVGVQRTFIHDTLNADFLFSQMSAMCGEVYARFQKNRFGTFKRLVVTVRFSDFETVSRRHSLKEPASSRKILQSEAIKLLMPFLDERGNPQKKRIRLVGVRIERLT